MSIKISSPTFQHNENIPAKYTCQGENINPPLEIEGVPSNSKSLVLIIDDPDAPSGNWDHWIVWNINPLTKKIPENSVPQEATQGINDFRRVEYGGPCPPSGTHRYFFKIFAIDTIFNLPSSARKTDVLKAMQGHVLDKFELVGLYRKT